MSLTLRQRCEPVLNYHNLSGFYADMNFHRNLCLNNDCGGTVITVPSINFSRTNPTVKECEYAAELLSTFLYKNGTAIRKLIKEADILDSMPNPDFTEFLHESSKYSVKMSMDFQGPVAFRHDNTKELALRKLHVTFVRHEEQQRGVFTYNGDFSLESFVCEGIEGGIVSTDVKEISKFFFDPLPGYYKMAMEKIALKETWFKQHQKVRQLRQELNSCKVSL